MLAKQKIQRVGFRLIGFLIFVTLSGLYVFSGTKAQTVEKKPVVNNKSQKFVIGLKPEIETSLFLQNNLTPSNFKANLFWKGSTESNGDDKIISKNQSELITNNISATEINNNTNAGRLEDLLPQLTNASSSLFFNKLSHKEYRKIGFSDVPLSPSLADSDTNLVASESDSIPLGARTPVILIHGIHGNQWPKAERNGHCFDCASDPYPKNFKNLIAALEGNVTFRNNFKIYRFHYVSDKNSVYDIAASLRNRVDSNPDLRNKTLVIIAHSMGGLVARSYMTQHNTDQGIYSGRRSGERVIKLITLATPHHGTPLVNGNVRVPISSSISSSWIQTYTALSKVYWKQNTNTGRNVNLQEPNRKDLLWDNFDGLWSSHPCYLTPRFCYLAGDSEKNDFLQTLNSDSSYDYKITPYWGTIGSNSNTNALSHNGPVDLGANLGVNSLLERHEQGLNILGVLLQRIIQKNFVTTGAALTLQNDGMVPAASSRFDGHNVSKRIQCIDFNHEDMFQGKVGLCIDDQTHTLKTLFQWLLFDLQGLVNVPKVLYARPRGTFICPRGCTNNIAESGLTQMTNVSEQIVELRNLGDAATQVTSLSLTGTDASQFSIVNAPALPFTVPARSYIPVTVRFNPSSTGVKIATITANNDSIIATATAELEGLSTEPNCDITVNPTDRYIIPDGGVGSFTVSSTGCSWTVSSDDYWIHASRNGQNVEYSVERNLLGLSRTGSIDIQIDNRQFSFPIYQDGTPSGCWLSLSEDQGSASNTSGNFNFTVSTPGNCIWSATTDSSWITVNPGVRIGTQPLSYSVTSNPNNSIRIGTIKITGQDFIRIYTVVQNGNIGSNCNYSLSPSEQLFPNNGGSNNFSLTTSSNCQWQVSSPDQWISVTSANNGIGNRTINYTVTANSYTSQRVGSIIIQGAGTNLIFSVRQDGQPVFYPDINLPVTNANVGNALLNTTIYQSFIIQNTGPGYLSIGSIYRGSGSAEFEILPYSNFLLAGESASVTVKFTPTSTGTKNAIFSITSNDPDESPINFNVSGTGVTQITGGIDFVWTNHFTVPIPQAGPCMATIANNIYLLSGSSSFLQNYKYDPTVNTWTRIADSPSGCSDGGATALNGKIYMVGAGNVPNSNRIQIYDPVSNQWTTGAVIPTNRQWFTVASANGKVYAFGGSVGNQSVSEVNEYDPVTNTWATKAAMPTARYGATAATINNLIYVIGGYGGFQVRNEVEAFNPITNTWLSRENMPTRRQFATSAVLSNKIYVSGGGNSGAVIGNVEEFDPSIQDSTIPGILKAWAIRNPLLTGRERAASGMVNNKLYVLGGVNNSGTSLGSVEQGALSASPKASLPVNSADFGNVQVGVIGEKSLEIQNLGNALLTLSFSQISGSQDFSLFSRPETLSGGTSAQIKVRIVPTSLGQKNATFRINTNDPSSPTITFSVAANGVAFQPVSNGAWQVIQSTLLSGNYIPRFIKIQDNKAYYSHSDRRLSVVDLGSGMEQANIEFASFPNADTGHVAVVGNKAYVALRNLASNGQVAVVNRDTNSVLNYIPIGIDPYAIASYNDRIYVSVVGISSNPPTIKVLDTNTNSVVATIPVGDSSSYFISQIAVEPLLGRAYVVYSCVSCNTESGFVGVIDLATNTITSTIPITSYRPFRIAITGNRAYVSTTASVEAIDLSTNTVLARIMVPNYSVEIAATPEYVFVTNNASGVTKIVLISTLTNTVVGELSAGEVQAIAADPTTNFVYAGTASPSPTFKTIRFITPTFSVTTNNQTLASPQGGNTTVTASVASIDGWTGPVTLSCEGLPTGGTCQFTQNPVNLPANGTGSTNVTINVPAGTVPGPYGFRVVGNGTGTGLLFTEPQTDFNNLALTVPTCEYQLSATQPINIGAAGGSGNINVSGTSGCGWTAASDAAWLRVTSGSSGNGNGTVNYTVDLNTGPPRSAILTIAGQPITVNQAFGCSYTLSSNAQNIGSAGGAGSFNVSALNGCTWEAATTDSWITITSGTSGDGNGTVAYTVAANTGPPRTGTISAAGQSFTINQAGGCTYSLSSGGINVNAAGAAGLSFNVIAGNGCAWLANSSVQWVTITSGAGNGNGIVNFDVARNTGALRQGTIAVAGQIFNITQLAGAITRFDYDGDGKADLSVFRPSAGAWYIARPTGIPAQNFDAVQFGVNGDLPVPSDYDGDGRTDVAVWRPSDGVWYLLQSTAGFRAAQFGANGDIPVPGDFDGDGKANLAVFRPSTGSWYIARATGVPNQNFDSVPFGANGDKPIAGADFDGDGRADVTVFRPSEGNWYRLNSSNNQFVGLHFGTAEDKPVAADYDGDGKTDLTVYRPSDGVWYRINSQADSFSAIQFGISSDRPSPADYDGDGKADLAVFRPAEGNWYILRSQQGYAGFQFGAAGDIPTPNSFVR